ncbi:MAG: YbdD/YjiX family protein [Rhodospirillaceae bacterium]|nr:YbdD/YjiX family protein [Rhodospirillaceae bacterium]
MLFNRVQQSARLMCGLPDYDIYVRHLRNVHPGQTVPSYEMFFRDRQEARYGRGMARCC